jgi:hypothetical protein
VSQTKGKTIQHSILKTLPLAVVVAALGVGAMTSVQTGETQS